MNPIIDWSDDDVWEFLHHYGCEANPLYQCGYGRIGCIGCPLGGYASMKREFRLYPKYKQLYIHVFERMVKVRELNGKINKGAWSSGEAVFNWWINADSNQLTFDGFDILDV